MATIAINDIKPNKLVFLTAAEAALLEGGDGWWDIPGQVASGVRGSITTGAGGFTGAYIGSGGDLFKATMYGATTAVGGYKSPVENGDYGKAVSNFSTSFATGVVAGYSGNHDHF